MLRRFKFLGVGVLTLACLVVPLSAAHAQHGRGGGSHVGSRSSFRPGFQPNFRGFNRREFDSRFNRFDRLEEHLERRFPVGRFDRFEDRLERRLFREPLPHFGSGLVPGLGLGFGGFGFPGFFPRFGLGFPIL
jgi:hypothetical protein